MYAERRGERLVWVGGIAERVAQGTRRVSKQYRVLQRRLTAARLTAARLTAAQFTPSTEKPFFHIGS